MFENDGGKGRLPGTDGGEVKLPGDGWFGKRMISGTALDSEGKFLGSDGRSEG